MPLHQLESFLQEVGNLKNRAKSGHLSSYPNAFNFYYAHGNIYETFSSFFFFFRCHLYCLPHDAIFVHAGYLLVLSLYAMISFILPKNKRNIMK